MKRSILILFILVATVAAEAQVTFRNSFVIGHHQKTKAGVSISSIVWNLGLLAAYSIAGQNASHSGFGYNGYSGRVSRNVVIDLFAINHPEKIYTYSELAQRVYGNDYVVQTWQDPVPTFLLLPPPGIQMPVYRGSVKGRRL
ncbi:hypothetical protein BH10BAC4_BH10BAC4_10430 [soil metagenome]